MSGKHQERECAARIGFDPTRRRYGPARERADTEFDPVERHIAVIVRKRDDFTAGGLEREVRGPRSKRRRSPDETHRQATGRRNRIGANTADKNHFKPRERVGLTRYPLEHASGPTGLACRDNDGDKWVEHLDVDMLVVLAGSQVRDDAVPDRWIEALQAVAQLGFQPSQDAERVDGDNRVVVDNSTLVLNAESGLHRPPMQLLGSEKASCCEGGPPVRRREPVHYGLRRNSPPGQRREPVMERPCRAVRDDELAFRSEAAA